MPLPPALAKRLAMRGVIQPKEGSARASRPAAGTSEKFEEVIAESYDDDEDAEEEGAPIPGLHRPAAAQPTRGRLQPLPEPEVSKFHRMGHAGCPNKSNPHHVCSQFCVSFWGRGKRETPAGYNAKRLAMLRKHPLPSGGAWVEVFDAGVGRHYYWNMDTGEVSWLSPSHPKAAPSRPASELREEILKKQLRAKAEAARNKDVLPPAPPGIGMLSGAAGRDEEGRDAKKRRLREAKDVLDPMDPAAYSDVPRGTWKSGLVEEGDAKSGVDSTASGPLFQQRPYPSPGDVLRANAEQSKKKN